MTKVHRWNKSHRIWRRAGARNSSVKARVYKTSFSVSQPEVGETVPDREIVAKLEHQGDKICKVKSISELNPGIVGWPWITLANLVFSSPSVSWGMFSKAQPCKYGGIEQYPSQACVLHPLSPIWGWQINHLERLELKWFQVYYFVHHNAPHRYYLCWNFTSLTIVLSRLQGRQGIDIVRNRMDTLYSILLEAIYSIRRITFPCPPFPGAALDVERQMRVAKKTVETKVSSSIAVI
jgi:hypothetical protein